ncbi:sensor histidine kinase [Pedobacter sp.]|uniref:sensor histidine kinase n=1 Tax=Pedobacter sp. TaxID=1411316 RepID=UPI003D7FBD15
MAFITFREPNKLLLKSSFGVNPEEIGFVNEERSSSVTINGFDVQFFSSAPLVSSTGVVFGDLCIVDQQSREVTEREEQLLQEFAHMTYAYMESRIEVALAMKQQNQLLQMAAHDLKNPLTTIPVRADLIKLKKHDPEAVDRMCDQVKNAGLSMTRIIDDLLSAARYESGKFTLYTLKLDFAALVAQIVDVNETLASHKGQTLTLQVNNRPFVHADEQRLTEVIDNLINNAIKYSPKGGQINVIVAQQDGRAILQVQDNGPGLTNEDKGGMFLPFSKLSAHPTGNETSTGLGLSIVKQLVDAHNGQVWAESDGAGKGSSFFVEIPSLY